MEVHRGNTIEKIIEHRGEPILRFDVNLEFKDPDLYDVPCEIAVFKLDNSHGGCIVFSRYNSHPNLWIANCGERIVITHLLSQLRSGSKIGD